MNYYEQLDAEEIKRLLDEEGWDYDDMSARSKRLYDELLEQEAFDGFEEVALEEVRDDLKDDFDSLEGLIETVYN